MRVVTPFANYLAGDSWLHQLDARLKLLLVAAYVFAAFAASTWLGITLNLVVLLVASASARIPLRRLMRGLLPVLAILIFTFAAHAFTFAPQLDSAARQMLAPALAWPELNDVVFFIIPNTSLSLAFSPAGGLDGFYFLLRIVELVSATTLLTLTSPLTRVSDAIAAILRPLALFRVPVEDIAMMFSIALRFIPLTAEEVEKLKYALTARGVRFGEGGLIRRLRAYLPVFVPLFVGLFRRADALACAMESRCYDGRRRTRLNSERFTAQDLTFGLLISLALVVWGLWF